MTTDQSTKQIDAKFPSFNIPPYPLNIADNGGGGSWSAGGQLIVPVSSQRPITRPWIVYGWSVVVLLTLWFPFAAKPYGKLGKLMAGPVLGSGGLPNPVSAQVPFSAPPSVALPNLATVWDGAQDAAPPFYPPGGTGPPTEGGRIAFSNQLPIPIQLDAGAQLGFGLWLTPTLTNGALLIISDATYTITYK